MRLSQKELNAIHQCFSVHFLLSDALWLFGSRVDDLKKGGDIDLYVETYYSDISQAIEKQIRFLSDLKLAIGEQNIDIVLNILNQNKKQRIYDEAKNTGIQLI